MELLFINCKENVEPNEDQIYFIKSVVNNIMYWSTLNSGRHLKLLWWGMIMSSSCTLDIIFLSSFYSYKNWGWVGYLSLIISNLSGGNRINENRTILCFMFYDILFFWYFEILLPVLLHFFSHMSKRISLYLKANKISGRKKAYCTSSGLFAPTFPQNGTSHTIN